MSAQTATRTSPHFPVMKRNLAITAARAAALERDLLGLVVPGVSLLSVMDLSLPVAYARRRRDRGHTSHLRRMQSPTDLADRTGIIGVEAFDATYGVGFQASDDSPHALECELVEDGGAFVAHRPSAADRPRRVAFVDGTLRTEARLTRTSADGDVSMGLGSWAAAAVLVDGNEPARFDQVRTGRAAIFHGRAGGPAGCQTTATAGAGRRTRSTGSTSKRPVSSSSA